MPLEIGSFVNDLTPTNPAGSDPAGQGDDHLRLIKACLQGSLPNLGQAIGSYRRLDTNTSLSSTWNTGQILTTGSATTTVTHALPNSASITAGFYLNISSHIGVTVVLTPSAGSSINGSATFTIPEQNDCLAYYQGGNSWAASTKPNGKTSNLFASPVAMASTLSVSGATALNALTVNGVTTLSAAVTMKSTLSISGAATFGGAVSISGAATFQGAVTISGQTTMIGLLNLTVGQIAFPATQNPSANANTLDDYEEGTFTPTLTYATPGTLNVVYTTRAGRYTKIGNLVQVDVEIATSTFTNGTAAGRLNVSGLPFSHAAETNYGAVYMAGWQLGAAGQMNVPYVVLPGGTVFVFDYIDSLTGNAVGINIFVTHSATNVILNFSMDYRV